MITAEYQEKNLIALEAKEKLYSSCLRLSDGHMPKESTGIRDAARAFFELFITGTPSERRSGLGQGTDVLSAARQMADKFIETLTLHHHLNDICTMSHESVRCIMDVALLRIVHPEVDSYCYNVAGAVRFEGMLGKQQIAVSIAPSLITDAIISPASIEINSRIYIIKIQFENVSFLLDELFSAVLLGRVKSIVRRKRGASEEFANMIESISLERLK